jgi:hypothetical protein
MVEIFEGVIMELDLFSGWTSEMIADIKHRALTNSERSREAYSRADPEEVVERYRKASEAHKIVRANRSQEELDDIGRRKGLTHRRTCSRRTFEEREAIGRNISEAQRVLRARRTFEEWLESNKKRSKSMVKAWSVDIEKSNEWSRSILKGSRLKPNIPESLLNDYFDSRCPGKKLYNGDGSQNITVGRRTPDFVCSDGSREVVEVLGSYWHPDSDEQDIIEHYEKYNYKCIIVWWCYCYLPSELDKIFGY